MNLLIKLFYFALLTLTALFALHSDYAQATFDLVLAIWLERKFQHR